jgi:hypothetical protein
VLRHSSTKPTATRIAAWSHLQQRRAPAEPGAREFLNDVHRQIAPHRTDPSSWFDLLDVEDYGSFGGRS